MNSYLIMDGQWGSTGKGLFAGFLALNKKPDAVICAFGPNAGHTCCFNDEKIVTQQLPTGIISPSVKKIFIGPGALINPDILYNEIKVYEKFLIGKKIIIHPRAAIINREHIVIERNLVPIASTRKGVGASLCDKIMRKPEAIVGNNQFSFPACFVVTEDEYYKELQDVKILQIESSQGFELGLNTGSHYPYCTSRDITPAQILSDCGLPHWIDPYIYVTLRTFPIRVGHEYDGKIQIGNSGPVYSDQEELEWNKGILEGIQPEFTTVTGKKRRIFTFSKIGFERMINFIKPDQVFLNFTNYMKEDELIKLKDYILRTSYEINDTEDDFLTYIGTGPRVEDIIKK